MNPEPANPYAVNANANPNPYLPPAYSGNEAMAHMGYRVEGNKLVVRPGAVLPPFCVKTNEPVGPEDVKSKNYTWCTPLVALLFLVSGLIAIIVYFIIRKHCTITFGLSPEKRKMYRHRIIFKSIATVALFCAIPIAAANDNAPLIATVVILFIIALISLLVGNSPLTISSHRNGEFWVGGCSKEFLARLAQG